MSYYVGSILQGSTGNQSFTLPFTPIALRFTISQLDAGPENNIAHYSQGMTNGTNSFAHATLVTSQLQITRYSETYCMAHYAIVSATTTRVISATLVSLDTNGFTLNFDRATLDYKITVEAFA